MKNNIDRLRKVEKLLTEFPWLWGVCSQWHYNATIVVKRWDGENFHLDPKSVRAFVVVELFLGLKVCELESNLPLITSMYQILEKEKSENIRYICFLKEEPGDFHSIVEVTIFRPFSKTMSIRKMISSMSW